MPTHLKTFDLVGIKEDVSDYISMITPTDTPFLSSIKTEKVKTTLYQWQEDQLRAVSSNAKEEGFEAVDSNRDQPSKRSNGTQILSETFRVSGTSEAVRLYGRSSVAAREMMKTGKLLKMDLEHALVGTAQTYVQASSGTPGEFAGVQAQIHADVTNDNSGTPRAFTEDLIIDTHETLYNEGSDATILMVKPSEAKIISKFSDNSGRTRDMGSGKKIVNVVSVYESPFGTVKVVKNRRIRSEDALLYEPSNWKLAVLRPWFREKLAKTGDSDRWMLIGEYGLKHNNQKASALITDLS